MTLLRFCKNCGVYTLDKTCEVCKNKTISPEPPRFSPQDRYGEYRRKLKKSLKEKKERGPKKNGFYNSEISR